MNIKDLPGMTLEEKREHARRVAHMALDTAVKYWIEYSDLCDRGTEERYRALRIREQILRARGNP